MFVCPHFSVPSNQTERFCCGNVWDEKTVALQAKFHLDELFEMHFWRFSRISTSVGGARGKFVSGAKVLAAVPRIWQPESFISNF